jgi:hypothetical protein
MPKAPKHPYNVVGYLVLLIIAVVLIDFLWQHPNLLISIPLLFISFLIFITWECYKRNLYFQQVAEERKNESICTFARSFNCRIVDTWVIRAVYEELLPLHSDLPLRISDRFEEDLELGYEDVEDIGLDMAYRAGRSLKNTEKNPLYGKVKTIGDLVLFLNNQPRTNTE